MVLNRATKFILNIFLDVLAERHLGVLIAAEQGSNAHEHRFFADFTFVLH